MVKFVFFMNQICILSCTRN